MTDYAAAQYCMTCIDQTYNQVLHLQKDGPSMFINYKIPFYSGNDTALFTNGGALRSVNAGFTLNASMVRKSNATNEVSLVADENTLRLMANSVVEQSDAQGFNETEYIEEMLQVGFFETYAKQQQTVLVAAVAGGVGALLVVGAVLAVVFVKKAKGKKAKVQQVMTNQ